MALAAGVYALIPNHQSLGTVVVKKMDISEDISVTGKIDTEKHVSLSFGRPGGDDDLDD